jgi:hypothetical protein
MVLTLTDQYLYFPSEVTPFIIYIYKKNYDFKLWKDKID